MRPDKFEVVGFPDLSVFKGAAEPGSRLRVCIATEEIIGPVLNGGIASTYYHLARMLTDAGHDVTVLYLKGDRSETEPISHWVRFYAELGISLVPLPAEPSEGFSFWQTRQFAAYLWLRNQSRPFDIVHHSEWRGGAYYALMAKGQGLAFHDTLFLTKASSPHIWNRLYMMDFLNSNAMLGVMKSEQIAIERGDMVIGGSAHLLRFMEQVGYKLPEGRTYVQPNVLRFERLNLEDRRGPIAAGDRVRSGDIVFFGRLEARKGLENFCQALDYLVARGSPPDRVSFLGKEAGSLPSHPNLPNKEFILQKAENWPFPVEIHDDFNQERALDYLTAEPRVAIMPSIVENSSMAVYEALLYRVPFLATAVGGTPELIHPEDREAVLTKANPRSIANGIERVLKYGALVARCSFSNETNLQTWTNFHEHLAGLKSEGRLRELSAPDMAARHLG